MELTHEINDDVVHIGIKGKLDSRTAPSFEERLMQIIDQGHKKIMIDFARLDYISSAGFRVLLFGARRLAESSGTIALFGLQPKIRNVFDIAGFSSIFSIFSSREEAEKSLKA